MNEEKVNERLEDHEVRIRKLETNKAVTATKLDITNKILAAIAVMIGGSIVTFSFSMLTKK